MLRALGVIFEKRDQFIKEQNELELEEVLTVTQLRRDDLEKWHLKRRLAELG